MYQFIEDLYYPTKATTCSSLTNSSSAQQPPPPRTLTIGNKKQILTIKSIQPAFPVNYPTLPKTTIGQQSHIIPTVPADIYKPPRELRNTLGLISLQHSIPQQNEESNLEPQGLLEILYSTNQQNLLYDDKNRKISLSALCINKIHLRTPWIYHHYKYLIVPMKPGQCNGRPLTPPFLPDQCNGRSVFPLSLQIVH